MPVTNSTASVVVMCASLETIRPPEGGSAEGLGRVRRLGGAGTSGREHLLVALDRLLADSDRLRRDFEILVFAQPLDCLLQRENARRFEAHGLVRAGSSHVSQLLALADVDRHVLLSHILTDDHADVY